MARPAYIVCADTCIEDKATSRLSFVSVLQKVKASGVNPHGEKASTGVGGKFDATLVSVWLFDDSDAGCEFENEVVIHSEDGQHEFCMQIPPFIVAPDASRSFQQAKIALHGLPPLQSSGVWNITNRIRKAGSLGDWISQSFPFIFSGDPAYFEVARTATFGTVLRL